MRGIQKHGKSELFFLASFAFSSCVGGLESFGARRRSESIANSPMESSGHTCKLSCSVAVLVLPSTQGTLTVSNTCIATSPAIGTSLVTDGRLPFSPSSSLSPLHSPAGIPRDATAADAAISMLRPNLLGFGWGFRNPWDCIDPWHIGRWP